MSCKNMKIVREILCNLRMNVDVLTHSSMNENTILPLLEKCQNDALRIGNICEIYEDTYNDEVKLLELFCECIYEIWRGTNLNKSVIDKGIECDNILKKISIGIESKKQLQKCEIVFFPYKYAMWDSMESIWRAAKSDNNCLVYVVPIPYFDKNSDGSLSKYHYEGNLFPPNVQVINYDDYDFSMRNPDIAYIHNPYDGGNYVTTIHPRFYSSELKPFVSQLIYVPYFFTDGVFPENQMYLRAYSHIDAMVVQNEKCKNQFKELGLRNKIYALGSPKLDRLLNKVAQQIVPQELNEYKTKKIVFLNTSINSFLNENEFIISKLEYLFSLFSNKKDFYLVWRPHPLLEATIQALRPNLYPQFIELKKSFFGMGNGYYDTTMDLDELVSICCCYIGDLKSSTVELFRVQGKPIISLDIQNINATKKSICFFDMQVVGNYIYFVDGDTNLLCCATLNNGATWPVGLCNSQLNVNKRLYSDIFFENGTIYACPFGGGEMVDYHIESNVLRHKSIDNNGFANCNRMHMWKNYIIYVPSDYNALIIRDTLSNQEKYYFDPVQRLRAHANNIGYVSMFASCVVDDYLYIASPTSNWVVKIELQTGNVVCEYEISSKSNGYWDMIYDGHDFWLNPFQGMELVRWNEQSHKISEYTNFPDDFYALGNNNAFIRIIDNGDTVLAFPKMGNKIIELNKESAKMRSLDIEEKYCGCDRKSNEYEWGSNFYFAKKQDGKIYGLSAYDNTLLIIDEADYHYDTCRFMFDERSQKQINKLYIDVVKNESNIFLENTNMSIDNFLDALRDGYIGAIDSSNHIHETFSNGDGSAGEHIHRTFYEIYKNS